MKIRERMKKWDCERKWENDIIANIKKQTNTKPDNYPTIKTPVWIIILSVLTLGLAYIYWLPYKKDKQCKLYVEGLISNSKIYKAQEFLYMYESIKISNNKISELDSPGIYIIHNTTKDKYYVGQSVNVIKRVNNHLKGKGNGDVYADFKYGSNLTIQIIKCREEDLNALEKQCIQKYNACGLGYNKNKGVGKGY